jgi:hypothetical protein
VSNIIPQSCSAELPLLRGPRRAALAAIASLVAAASLVSFGESYRGLYLWAHHHGLAGRWAAVWPLQVDVFIAVGELALFVGLADRWSVRSRIGAWLVTLAGLAVSVAGNVGHIGGHDLASRATAAVPPLAASAALAVGLGVLKRVVGARAEPVPEAAPKPVPAPARKRAPVSSSRPAPRPSRGRAPVTPETAELAFGARLAEGDVPSLREVKSTLRLGTDRAREVRAHLVSVAGVQA